MQDGEYPLYSLHFVNPQINYMERSSFLKMLSFGAIGVTAAGSVAAFTSKEAVITGSKIMSIRDALAQKIPDKKYLKIIYALLPKFLLDNKIDLSYVRMTFSNAPEEYRERKEITLIDECLFTGCPSPEVYALSTSILFLMLSYSPYYKNNEENMMKERKKAQRQLDNLYASIQTA